MPSQKAFFANVRKYPSVCKSDKSKEIVERRHGEPIKFLFLPKRAFWAAKPAMKKQAPKGFRPISARWEFYGIFWNFLWFLGWNKLSGVVNWQDFKPLFCGCGCVGQNLDIEGNFDLKSKDKDKNLSATPSFSFLGQKPFLSKIQNFLRNEF